MPDKHKPNHILNSLMQKYPLDRTVFKAHTAIDASAMHARYYKKRSWRERLIKAQYLNSIAYNFAVNDPPRLDRTKFSARARNG